MSTHLSRNEAWWKGRGDLLGAFPSERKDKHAIKFILTTIKPQVLLATGDDFSPSRIVIDFDQGNFPSSSSFKFSPPNKLESVLTIEETLPKAEIVFCSLHMFRAVMNKAMEFFQGIELDNSTGKDFVQAVIMVELRDFWLSTTSLLDLDHNLQVYFLENQNDSK